MRGAGCEDQDEEQGERGRARGAGLEEQDKRSRILKDQGC